MERYVCIHCHFYQPPRENPWLETIEVQDSAYPYHDWNERITAECYARNAASRILDDQGKIIQIVNNLGRINFNFGPTLMSWMEQRAPDIYARILEAERESRERFCGHSSALAQCYNHMIMPLASAADKRTQTLWGIRDYEHRFGHEPEGMWLPETAVDIETLELLAEYGIRFTVLAPSQARRVRRFGARAWRDVSGARIDPSQAYQLRLPSGRQISLFFYDGPISRAVAFEGLLSNGENFANRLLGGFNDARGRAQLSHIATDGETYGHHHRHGEMALSYALHFIETNQLARLTNYGEFLEKYPPQNQVEISEKTAWSCAHGVGRWIADCGCNIGGHGGWNQAWRAPLRAALDWLRDSVCPLYCKEAGNLFSDPWRARNGYIDVVLDRSAGSLERFFEAHAARALNAEERVRALKLLELQRHAMLMYTSCGWFFDEVSGIETVQVLHYAGRVVQLAEELFRREFEQPFLERAEKAKSNLPEHVNAARIYEKWVKPRSVDLLQVMAHYAINSLFESYKDRAAVYCYTVERRHYHRMESGRIKLAVGCARIQSSITRESAEMSFHALHFGDHNLTGGVRLFHGDDSYQAMITRVAESFSHADLPEVIRLLDKEFGAAIYSLQSLFRDERTRIFRLILGSALEEAEGLYRNVYEHNAPLMMYFSSVGDSVVPPALRTAAEFVLNNNLLRAMHDAASNKGKIAQLLNEANVLRVPVHSAGLSYEMQQTLERIMESLILAPFDSSVLRMLRSALEVTHRLPFDVDLWRLQNMYYEILRCNQTTSCDGAESLHHQWLEEFRSLGEMLGLRM